MYMRNENFCNNAVIGHYGQTLFKAPEYSKKETNNKQYKKNKE